MKNFEEFLSCRKLTIFSHSSGLFFFLVIFSATILNGLHSSLYSEVRSSRNKLRINCFSCGSLCVCKFSAVFNNEQRILLLKKGTNQTFLNVLISSIRDSFLRENKQIISDFFSNVQLKENYHSTKIVAKMKCSAYRVISLSFS